MFIPDHAALPAKEKAMQHVVLELTVNNHPGVMSHVCGLFSRRAYNVEGIACMPVGDGAVSRIWLLVEDQRRLEQMIAQVGKLEDVRRVDRHGGDHPVFAELGRLVAG